MAISLNDDLPVLKQYLYDVLPQLGLKDSDVIAHAIAFNAPPITRYFLAGPKAGRELQMAIIATTKDHFIIIYTQQNFAETPRIAKTDYVPLTDVQLIKAKEGLLSDVLKIKLHDKTLKLIIAKAKREEWNNFEALCASLSKA
jgi:hypothetical protein